MAHETHVLPADGAVDGGISEECWCGISPLRISMYLWWISPGKINYNALSDKFKSEQFLQSKPCETRQHKVRSGFEAWKTKTHLCLCVFSPVSRTVTSSRPSAGARAHHEGQSDLLLESSFYNFYQPSCYPSYYSNLYNYQQYQVSSAGNTRPCSQINRNCLTVHNSRFLHRRSMAAWNMRWNDWCWSLWYNKSPLRPLLYKICF